MRPPPAAGRRRGTRGILVALVVSLHGGVAGQTPAGQGGSGFAPDDDIVTTRHEIDDGGQALAYTTHAGRIPIRHNATGETRGDMFFVAYSAAAGENTALRPLTFAWNGGPGSSSSLVHLLGFGPKRIGNDGEIRSNEGTWLGATDLVFVDPIGTGYSRPVREEYGAEFYQDRGDAESVAEFIRVYLTRADAWERPLFLAGESFGVLRAIRVADVLRGKGIPVAGLIHIGLVPPLAEIGDPLETALAVPTYAAAAHYHRRLDPALQGDLESTLAEAERWARDAYAPALERPGSLTAGERAEIRAGLARLTGIGAEAIDSTLVIPMGVFAATLLADEGRVVGRYDSRVTGPIDRTQTMYDPTTDPSLENIIDDVAVIRYMRDELGYRSDLRYQGPFGGGYPPPDSFRGDWMSVMWDRSEDARAPVDDRSSDPTPAVERVMRANEALRLFVACGYYDLVCSYALIEEMVASLDPTLADRITVRIYPGGHAVYDDDRVRGRMRTDVTAFIDGVSREAR